MRFARSSGFRPPMPFEEVFEMDVSRIERWFQFITGPRVTISTEISGTPYVVNNQADLDYLVGKRVNGWVSVYGSNLHGVSFGVKGVPLDPSVYVYNVDGNGYPLLQADIDKRAALNGMHRELITFQPGANGNLFEYLELDGVNERAYTGFGGASYVENNIFRYCDISRTGDDGGKMSRNMIAEYNYFHDMRPWVDANDGTYYGGPNDVRYPHLDILQVIRGNATIRRNFMWNTTTAPTTSVFLAKPDTGEGSTSLLIEENIMHGSNNYPVQLVNQAASLGGAGATLDGVIVRNNLISKDFGGFGAHPTIPFAVGTLYSDQVSYSGNRWLEDKTAIATPYMAPRP